VAGTGVLAGCQATAPVNRTPQNQASSPSAAVPFRPFPVYTNKAPRRTHYAPSGYMGDSDLTLSGAYGKMPQGEGPCLRVTYKSSGPRGWSGIYWQDPANNWGDVPGRAGYDLRGATRLTFWARGDVGGEKIHEFRVGGIVGQYPDSDVATLSNIRLTSEWKQYTIDLSKKDLRHIIAGFGFFVNKAENAGGMIFYLNDIFFEGPETSPAIAENQTPLTGQLPQETTTQVSVAASTPVVPASAKDLEIKQVDAGLKVSFSSRLMFKSGKSVLEPASDKILNQLISLLNAYPTNRVLVEGHTDSTGDKHFNLRLSELRAKAVRDYLIEHGGYESSRFQVTGYGDTKPVAGNDTPSDRAQNRRVEVTILKNP
jgi:outer membrane protein OmpA-like peptidoglycan-associated protein